MKAKKYIKSTAAMMTIRKYFNLKVIASMVASLMLLYTPVALYNYTKENGTLLYDIAEAQISSTVPIVKGNIKTEVVVEETSSYNVSDGFEEALENGAGTTQYNSSNNTNYQSGRPSSTPTNNNQISNNKVDNTQNTTNEVVKDISFLKGTSISMVEGDSFNPIINLGIVAHDKDGTDITSRVSIDENTVDINNEGSYYVKASVKLNDGSTLEKVFTVKVNPKKEVTYEVNNFEMLENTAPKLGTARIFFDSKVSDDTISPVKATVNGVEYNINTFGKSSFGGTTRHYIDVNVGDISGEFKLNVEKVEFSNGVSVWPGKQMSVYVMKSEPVVSNFSYTEGEEGKISTIFDLKDLDDSLSNIKVYLYDEKGILIQEHKVAKKEKYNLDFSVEANGKYTLEVIGDVNLYNDLNRLNQSRVILSENIEVSKIDKSDLKADDLELLVGEELNIDKLNIKAFDINGDDITNKVSIDTSNLDTSKQGKYEVLLTVINSNNEKLEKIITITVNDIKNSSDEADYNEVVSYKTRSSRSINEEIVNSNKSARGLVSQDSSKPAYGNVKLTGTISSTDGNAPSGRLEVEIPSNINFVVNRNGEFFVPTNYKITNRGSDPVEVYVVDFIEESPGKGITIKNGNISQNDTRDVVSLEIEGNAGKTALYTNSNLNQKIAEVDVNSQSNIILRGEAGKTDNNSIDSTGTSEKFVLSFKVIKK